MKPRFDAADELDKMFAEAVATARAEAIDEVCMFLEMQGYAISAREVREEFDIPRRAA